MYNIWNIYFW